MLYKTGDSRWDTGLTLKRLSPPEVAESVILYELTLSDPYCDGDASLMVNRDELLNIAKQIIHEVEVVDGD